MEALLQQSFENCAQSAAKRCWIKLLSLSFTFLNITVLRLVLLLAFCFFFSEILDSAVEGFSKVMPIKVLSFSVLISTSAPLRRIRWSVYSTVKKKDRCQMRKRKATLICCFVIYLLYIVFFRCPTPTISVIIQNDFAFLSTLIK